MISEQERERFLHCTVSQMTSMHLRDSIGKLSEKTVHAVLKDYFACNKDCQEVKLGRYVADIFDDGHVTEIQTANLGLLRPKLSAFLQDYPVTVVLPVPHDKWIVWIDPETGEVIKKNKSPIKGSVYEAFKELYRIKPFIVSTLNDETTVHPLTIRIMLIDMEEYRLLDGWSHDKKRGSHRYDRNPVGLYDEILLSTRDDYSALIPESFPEPFTVKELADKLHVRKSKMGICVNVLASLGIIQRVENIGRSYAYIRV